MEKWRSELHPAMKETSYYSNKVSMGYNEIFTSQIFVIIWSMCV